MGARTQPRFTLLRMLKAVDVEPLKTTVPFMSSWKDLIIRLMMLRSLGGHPILGRILKRPSLLTRSKVFVRSMKATKSGCLCSAFLLKLSEWEDLVYSGYVGTEAALRLRVDLLCKYFEPLQYYTCKDFPNNTDEGYAAIIIAIVSVTLVFVRCDDISISHVLWYFAFTPTEADNFMQLGDECLFATLRYFSGNTVFPGALPEARESRASLSSPMVGTLSSYFSSGRHSIAFRASSVTKFPLAYSSV